MAADPMEKEARDEKIQNAWFYHGIIIGGFVESCGVMGEKNCSIYGNQRYNSLSGYTSTSNFEKIADWWQVCLLPKVQRNRAISG